MRQWVGGAAVMVAVGALMASSVFAQDWPQWRGANRDGKVAGFKAPAAWPKELTQKWKVQVGNDDASPVLVGDKVYVFTRQEGDEVTLCLNAADGKEIWKDKNPVAAITGPAAKAHGGPRATPVVVVGVRVATAGTGPTPIPPFAPKVTVAVKVVTLGVTGVVSCLDAVTGKPIWRKDKITGAPKFFTSSSPLVTDGLVVAQLGPEGTGVIVAYDLATGEEKWKVENHGAAYASPVAVTIEGKKQIVTLTDKAAVGLDAADGKVLWQYPFAPKGMNYNAATPIVDGSTVIVSGAGRGTVALKIARPTEFDVKHQAAGAIPLAATEAWTSPTAVQFCTPLLKDGFIYGVSDKGFLFCLNAKDGSAVWTDTTKVGNYGVMLDVGSAVLALPNNGTLLVVKPGEKQYTELAKYKVSEGQTYACLIVAGNRIFVKDMDSLILWTVEPPAAK
jgi:outer membrane protein assembly factor BamB